jgi:hypothetical protein
MVWDRATQEYIARESAAWREAKRLLTEAVRAAQVEREVEQSDQPNSQSRSDDRATNDIDDREQVEQMEQMRLGRMVSGKWKAADSLCADAKGRTPNVQLASKRKRLMRKYDKKYPGAVW